MKVNEAEPPKVRHTPVRSGKVGSTVTLKVTVTPSDSYTGVLYYRGAPGGSWESKSISGGENGKITAKLNLGSWIEDDHETAEYYFLVDGPGGSSGAGIRGGRTCRADKKSEKEWEEIGKKVEKKVMRDLKDWAKDEGREAGDRSGESEEAKKNKEDWEEIGKKVEKKIKRKIKEWAEEE